MREAVETFLRERTPGARIPFVTSDLVPSVVDGLHALLADLRDQPPDAWGKWQAHHRDDDEPEDGLIVRGQGTGKDPKVYWQWRPRTFQMLRQNHAAFTPARTDFIVACQQMYRRCRDISIHFAREMDAALPGYGFAREVESYSQHVLRILSYDPVPGLVARRHVDKCFFTLHVAESRDGLTLWDQPVRDLRDEAIVFPGLKAELMTGKRIAAAEHAVEQGAGVTDRRWSVVFFAHTSYKLPQNAEHLTRR